MELHRGPTDFLGLNVYAGNFVRAGGVDGQPRSCHSRVDTPKEDLRWLKITPQSLYWAVQARGRGLRGQDVLHDGERGDIR